MEKDTKSSINNSSLVDLKAELFRKHEEFKQQKLASGSLVKGRIQKKKPDLFTRKNKGVLERAQKDFEEKVEEEDALTKSRKALEAKAKLYDKMSSSSTVPEEDAVYLVDFQKKVIDRIVEIRDRERAEGNTEATKDEELTSDVPPPSDPQEEWVDYTDSLGRSRKCMKKDLPQLVKQDKEMAKLRGESRSSRSSEPEAVDTPTLMSSDMHRELLRQRWEKEEEEALENDNVHYSNVQFDEIRTHGVGFYQFDKSNEKREEQMDALNKLREQTVDERSRRERLKEKRKAMMDARLAKVKQRRKLKDGATIEESKDDEEIGPKLEEMLTGRRQKVVEAPEKKESEPLTRDDSWRKSAPVREWDKGKEKTGLFTQEKYMSDRRGERQAEFAPPSLYYDNPPTKRKTSPNQPPVVSVSRKPDKPKENSQESMKPVEIDVSSIPLPSEIQDNASDLQVSASGYLDLTPQQPASSLSKGLELSAPSSHFVPLPDTSLPPPGYEPVNQWPSNYSAQNYGPAYQNLSGPPVGYSQALDTSVPPPGMNPVTSDPPIVHTPSEHTSNSQSGQERPGVHQSKPAVYVPRSAVLDTRLVQNVDSESPSDSVPQVEAQPYNPGSFTAALRAENQAHEVMATVSSDKAHFKGGPVLYSKEADAPDGSGDKTEVEVTAFLREIRENL